MYAYIHIYIHISLYIYTHDTFPSNTQTIQWRSRDDMQPGTTIWTAFARVDARICEETEKCGVWQPRWVLMHQGQRCLLGFDMNHVGTIFNSLNFQLIFMAFLSNCFLLQHAKFDLYWPLGACARWQFCSGFPHPTAHTKWTRVEVGTRILLTWNRNNDGFCRCVGVPTTVKYALIEVIEHWFYGLYNYPKMWVFSGFPRYVLLGQNLRVGQPVAQVVEHGVQSWLQRAWGLEDIQINQIVSQLQGLEDFTTFLLDTVVLGITGRKERNICNIL